MASKVSVTFYSTTDDPRVINKELTIVKTISCDIYMPCSLISPTILADYDPLIFKANYCHIGDPFNRYYFMGDPVLDNAKRVSVPLKVDVRKTWEAELKEMETLVTRREGKTQIRIPDEKIGALGGCKNYYYMPKTGNMFEPVGSSESQGWSLSWNIVLELIGGAPEEEE